MYCYVEIKMLAQYKLSWRAAILGLLENYYDKITNIYYEQHYEYVFINSKFFKFNETLKTCLKTYNI